MVYEKCQSKHIRLEHKKDHDTGFWANYWWCSDYDAKTIPKPLEFLINGTPVKDAVETRRMLRRSHPKFGLSYVGETSKGFISLHNLAGKRITQSAKKLDLTMLNTNKWRTQFLPSLKGSPCVKNDEWCVA